MISKSKTSAVVIAFICFQLALWYGGIADIVSTSVVQRWNPAQMISVLCIIFFYILARKQPSIIAMLLLAVKIIPSITLILHGHIIDIVELCRYVGLVLTIDYLRERFDIIIKVLMLVFEFIVYYNFYILINSTKDIYGGFYGALGYDNDFTRYMLAAYCVAILYYCVSGKYIRSLCLITVSHITLFYAGVGSGITGLLVVDIVLILGIYKAKKISLLTAMMIYLIAEIGIVFLKLQYLFSFFIVDFLEKDMSLTGRTELWEKSISLILKRPIMGYGDMTLGVEKIILGDYYCHNSFLEILFRGGILNFILYGLLIIFLHRKCKQFLDEKTYSAIVAVILGICFAGLTESLFQLTATIIPIALLGSACDYVKIKSEGVTN